MEKKGITGCLSDLYFEIDDCIDSLISARMSKNSGKEMEALCRMEGLMVKTQQTLSYGIDYINGIRSQGVIQGHVMSKTESLHYELCCKGAIWIRQRKNCEPRKAANILSVVELVCMGAERTDVYATNGRESTIIEVKTSRADFLADRMKVTRQNAELSMGNFRYYLCPKGIINPEDLPDGWGLLWYDGQKISKVVQAGEQSSNQQMDIFVLASILRREGITGRVLNYRNYNNETTL